MHYRDGDVWHERSLLLDLEIADADVWIVLTPDMDVYGEDMNDNLGVRVCAAGNAVPRSIARGQAYRFDSEYPTEGEHEAYQELAENYRAEELARMMAIRPILRSTGARGPRSAAPGPGRGGPPPAPGEDDDDPEEEEEEEGKEEEEDAPPSGSSSTERWRVFSLGGPYDYGDEVKLPSSATRMPGDKAALFLVDGVPVAAKKVRDEDLDSFMALVAKQDARIMPVVRGRTGRRHRTWQRIGEDSEEVDMDDWPLAGSRTATWCIDYLVKMGQTIEGHHEDFTRRCKLERNSWGCKPTGRRPISCASWQRWTSATSAIWSAPRPCSGRFRRSSIPTRTRCGISREAVEAAEAVQVDSLPRSRPCSPAPRVSRRH